MGTTRADAPPRTFDHERVARYPEYHALRQALDALGRALDRDDPPGFDRAAFVDAAADMARTSYAADWCPCCRHIAATGDDPACWPHAAVVSPDGWMRGTYRCPRTGTTWQCGYASPNGAWP